MEERVGAFIDAFLKQRVELADFAFSPLALGDVRRNATDRIWLTGTVAQQKFCRDNPPLSLSRRHGFLKLDRYAGLNHLPIIRAYRLSDIMRMDIEVGFSADLIALHPMAAFLFSSNQHGT